MSLSVTNSATAVASQSNGYKPALMFLSAGGKSFSLIRCYNQINRPENGGYLNLMKNPYSREGCRSGGEHPSVISVRSAPESIMTNQQMLSFLKANRSDSSFTSSVFFFHENSDKYKGHTEPVLRENPTLEERYENCFLKGADMHPHTIDEVIEFEEMVLNSPHAYFNTTGAFLHRTYSNLYHYGKVPILGIFPAALKALLGVVQMTAGIALSILSAPFALFSESASIVFHRSLRHIGHGPANVLIALIQAVVHGVCCGAVFGAN